MSKDYLIIFNADGTRLNTYANGVHYKITEPEPIKEINENGQEIITGYTEEQIINLVNGFDYQTVLNNGGVWFNVDNYNKLAGNTGKEYIYQNEQIVEKPAYVPTAEEIQEQERAKLDAEYAKLFTNKDNEIINAVVLMQDEEYAQQLRQERTELMQEYLTKRSAL